MQSHRSRTLSLTLSVALLLGLAACQTDTTTTTPTTADTVGVTMDPAVPMPGQMGESTVAGTNSALENGVTQLPAQDALSNIDGWISRLEAQNFAQRDNIVSALRDLRGALQESPIDGTRVAAIMDNLGDWTTQAGTDANNADVQRMGQLLTQNAQRLRTGTTGTTGPVGVN